MNLFTKEQMYVCTKSKKDNATKTICDLEEQLALFTETVQFKEECTEAHKSTFKCSQKEDLEHELGVLNSQNVEGVVEVLRKPNLMEWELQTNSYGFMRGPSRETESARHMVAWSSDLESV